VHGFGHADVFLHLLIASAAAPGTEKPEDPLLKIKTTPAASVRRFFIYSTLAKRSEKYA